MQEQKRPATFSQENQLPSLPLPTLQSTLKKYLESAKVFLNDNEYLKTQKIVEDFEYGVGSRLHFYLSEKAKNERNWLEKWWFDWGYLEWREPIAPYINTTGNYYNKDFINKSSTNGVSVQLACASLQIYYMMCYFEELRFETLPCDASRNGYLSMEQYRRLLNTCRIPLKFKDRLDVHFRTYKEGDCSTNVVIIHKHRFFVFNVYHKSEKTLLNVSEIYEKLNKLVNEQADKSYGVGLGALTGDYRDTWAENLEYLYKLDANNEKNMRIIQESVFVVVLDDCIVDSHDDIVRTALCGNSKNRFFDKSLQLIITKNGYTALNTDHTPFDGIISVNMSNYVQTRMIRETMNDVSKVKLFKIRENVEDIKELNFVYDVKIVNAIEKAFELFNQNSAKVDIKIRNLGFCTKADIKSYKVHPDTFVQLCMQLAYYNLHRKPAPTYETASTRAYYHGRTETLRSCTQESLNWSKSMCEGNLNKSELLNLFKIACNKHNKLMNEACNNCGCDRHLLGLRLIADSHNFDVPEIYKDISWTKSGGDGNFLISSSCIGFTDIYGGCYPMCIDGYGIFYRIGDDGITFFVTTFKSSKVTNILKMHESLEYAIKSVQKLYETISKI